MCVSYRELSEIFWQSPGVFGGLAKAIGWEQKGFGQCAKGSGTAAKEGQFRHPRFAIRLCHAHTHGHWQSHGVVDSTSNGFGQDDTVIAGALTNNPSIRAVNDIGSIFVKGSILGSVGVAGDITGQAVSAAGDVNGHGMDDLLIGANAADPAGRSNAGQSCAVFGRTSAGEMRTSPAAHLAQ